ncbi:hypothetical protein KKE60_06645 [Patescibacteria group bacterium]|nr:hypothetical protein [Patescibacteria group bacterium]
MFDLNQFQREHKKWTDHNFPDAPAWQSFVGAVEELGELAHAFLKLTQGIRGAKEEHIAEMRDAIGDVIIYLSHFCNVHGFLLSKIIDETWTEVRKRDWKKYPGNGVEK